MHRRIGPVLLAAALLACQSEPSLLVALPPPPDVETMPQVRRLLGTSRNDLWFYDVDFNNTIARLRHFDGTSWQPAGQALRPLAVAGPGAVWVAHEPIGRLHADGTFDDFAADFEGPVGKIFFGASDSTAIALVEHDRDAAEGGWSLYTLVDGRFRKWNGVVPTPATEQGTTILDAAFGSDDFWALVSAQGWHFDGTGFQPVDLGPAFDGSAPPSITGLARDDVWAWQPGKELLLLAHFDGETWSTTEALLPPTYADRSPFLVGWSAPVPIAPGRLAIFQVQGIEVPTELRVRTYAEGRVAESRLLRSYPGCTDSVSTPICWEFSVRRLSDGNVVIFRNQRTRIGEESTTFLDLLDPSSL